MFLKPLEYLCINNDSISFFEQITYTAAERIAVGINQTCNPFSVKQCKRQKEGMVIVLYSMTTTHSTEQQQKKGIEPFQKVSPEATLKSEGRTEQKCSKKEK